MTDIDQGTLIGSPSTTGYTDQPIIRTLFGLYNTMRCAECRPKRRRGGSAIREVNDSFAVRSVRIEIFGHVLTRQLAEGVAVDPESAEDTVDAR